MKKRLNHITNYLNKRTLYPSLIASPPASDLQLIVTIPCYKEPNLLHVLDTLKKCKLPLHKSVEVIVLINNAVSATEEIKQQNRMTFLAAQDWSNQYNTKDLQFHILYIDNLPDKHAGVGLARKIAMDEAIRRFHSLNRPNGIIACLDADSSVASNYFEALCNYFEKHINCPAVDIYYEHPLEGNDFNEKTYDAILDYELHLRYYVHALQKAGLTNATQTVGSAMAVRTIAYAKQGGMNRRKAGEDFYFLHKFTAFEDFGHLVSTTVFPSPRTSDRVPFGTGKAIHSILEGHVLTTYHPAIFSDLKVMLSGIENSYLQVEVNTWMDQLPLSIQQFFIQEDFALKWQELKQNTSNIRSFQKRFFQWFDAFKAMKYVHFARDHFYPNLSVEEAVGKWLEEHTDLRVQEMSKRAYLLHFRSLDRSKKMQ